MWKASFLKSVDWQFVIPAYCLLSLKQLCVASHNCFYDKYIIMQSSVAWKDANIINSSVVCISPCQTARIYNCCTISKCIIDMTEGVLDEEKRMLSKAGRGDLANKGSKVWESRRWVSLISRGDKSSDCGLHRCERLWLWVVWIRPWGERMFFIGCWHILSNLAGFSSSLLNTLRAKFFFSSRGCQKYTKSIKA